MRACILACLPVDASTSSPGKGSAHLIEDLLLAGADPSARVANPPPRSTPLHSACRSTRLEAVQALLRGGADETLGDLTPPPVSPLAAAQAAAAAAAAAHAAQPGALAAALAALAAAGIAGAPPGVGANGAVGASAGAGAAAGVAAGAAAPSPPPRPATTPLGVVGIGNFGAGQDPTQRGPTENPAEFARRRDPQTMEAIRQALRCVDGGVGEGGGGESVRWLRREPVSVFARLRTDLAGENRAGFRGSRGREHRLDFSRGYCSVAPVVVYSVVVSKGIARGPMFGADRGGDKHNRQARKSHLNQNRERRSRQQSSRAPVLSGLGIVLNYLLDRPEPKPKPKPKPKPACSRATAANRSSGVFLRTSHAFTKPPPNPDHRPRYPDTPPAHRNAPKDRAWRRRSWLVMLRASAEAEASARATREKWELSSMTGSLVRMIGSGLVLGDNNRRGPGGGEKNGQRGEGGVRGGHGRAGGKDQETVGGGEGVDGDGDGGDGGGGGGGGRPANGIGNGSCADEDDAKRVRRGGGSGGSDEAEEDDSATTNGAAAATEEAGSSPAWGGHDGERGGGGDDEEGAMELRFLCGRLFDLAAVEEGAFRRVLSYL